MKRIALPILLSFASALTVSAQSWMPDSLPGYQMRYVQQKDDYAGKVRCTIIRYDKALSSDCGVLYIHGFNDYFFQTEMGEQYAANGYQFYALDLRKYGRSLMHGQKRCQARNLNEYFADIDSALNIIRTDGCTEITIMGHSTGGLIAAYYIAKEKPKDVTSLILNSPFLDWNLGKLEPLVGTLSGLGKVLPNLSFSSGSSTAYGYSLNDEYRGEWHFNTQWKSLHGTEIDLGWIRAINSAQNYLKRHPYSVEVPVLLMYSDSSVLAHDWEPAVSRADAVLDVKDIKKYGSKLSLNTTLYKVPGGMHDLILSAEDVRYPLYRKIFAWLDKISDCQ